MEFAFDDGVVLSSKFDSGNLYRAEQVGPFNYHIYIARDCQDTEFETAYRTWFHLSVTGVPEGRVVTLSVRNLNKQSNLFNNGHRPVFKALPSSPEWRRVPLPVDYEPAIGEGCFRLTLRHRQESAEDTLFFAFCYPQSYEECQAQLDVVEALLGNDSVVAAADDGAGAGAGAGAGVDPTPKPTPASESPASASAAADGEETAGDNPDDVLKGSAFAPYSPIRAGAPAGGAPTAPAASTRPDLYFARELATRSLDGRRLDLVTLTSTKGITDEREDYLPGLFPDRDGTRRPRMFEDKRVVFVSARVHPGEVPASFVFDGILDFLLLPDDPRARALLDMFVFKLVPMLNPDGVARGHYRADQRGVNLNRCYVNPSPETEPTIYAAKTIACSYHSLGLLHMYLDLHAHATKRGCFIYGNHLPRIEDQVINVLYARLVAMHSTFMEFGACNFSEKNMKAKDKRDKGVSKEGSGRVGMYTATNLTLVYTLECNYNTGRELGAVPPAIRDDGRASPARDGRKTSIPKYTTDDWRHVGKATMVALLELEGVNPWPRIPRSSFKTLEGAKSAIERLIAIQHPYKEQRNARARRKSAAGGRGAGAGAGAGAGVGSGAGSGSGSGSGAASSSKSGGGAARGGKKASRSPRSRRSSTGVRKTGAGRGGGRSGKKGSGTARSQGSTVAAVAPSSGGAATKASSTGAPLPSRRPPVAVGGRSSPSSPSSAAAPPPVPNTRSPMRAAAGSRRAVGTEGGRGAFGPPQQPRRPQKPLSSRSAVSTAIRPFPKGKKGGAPTAAAALPGRSSSFNIPRGGGGGGGGGCGSGSGAASAAKSSGGSGSGSGSGSSTAGGLPVVKRASSLSGFGFKGRGTSPSSLGLAGSRIPVLRGSGPAGE